MSTGQGDAWQRAVCIRPNNSRPFLFFPLPPCQLVDLACNPLPPSTDLSTGSFTTRDFPLFTRRHLGLKRVAYPPPYHRLAQGLQMCESCAILAVAAHLPAVMLHANEQVLQTSCCLFCLAHPPPVSSYEHSGPLPRLGVRTV